MAGITMCRTMSAHATHIFAYRNGTRWRRCIYFNSNQIHTHNAAMNVTLYMHNILRHATDDD